MVLEQHTQNTARALVVIGDQYPGHIFVQLRLHRS
jgi:hypothetical protein